ncbi:hypothetical protein [Parendozoicomonas sp. Alg238-R29]|uniref:hypothetical protein n=1 Tax=Parendozoicomonas sp. Alg238-R29 TaxID=2993446 RepID=UPI00248EFF2F|nr:hypothetical protein [Parendozoicomonas sp. Alg238-R29]
MNRLPFLPLMVLLFLAGCQTAPQYSNPNQYSATGPVISAIEADITANRLTRPTGNNAMEKIHRLELISPNDPLAEKYREKIARQLVKLGQKAFLDKKYYRAKVLALRALDVSPAYPDAGYILDAIREAQKPLSAPVSSGLPTEIVDIEQVSAPASVGIITVTVPDVQGTVEDLAPITTEQID